MVNLIFITMLFSPLVGAILNGLLLRSSDHLRAGKLATLFSCLSFLCTCLLYFQKSDYPITISGAWISTSTLTVPWGLLFDELTFVMALVITGVGSLIHFYSIAYMSDEKRTYRYFSYLNLFLFSMLLLVCGSNLPVLFVGWEGVGLCSYLLIGYWFEDPEKAKAGMKAFVVNRIGDAGFLIGMFILFSQFKTFSFNEIKILLSETSVPLETLQWASFFLIVGALGKSAQIPLFVWLPDAMAGPTPVSALIHAATMVTAGIYLVVRMQFLFVLTKDVNLFISFIGAFTALIGALIATQQRDIKKILAYSTVSQLGLMFLGLGVGAYTASMFHLVTHAFFKALLFLGAGSVIHALHGEQNIYKMGGLKSSMPITAITFLVGSLALSGIPPFSGFFSKDLILYAAFASRRYGTFFWVIGLFTTFLTAFYMTKLFVHVFLGRGGSAPSHESPKLMTYPMILLGVGSVFGGAISLPHEFHLARDFLGDWISRLLIINENIESHLSPWVAMGVALSVSVLGMIISYFRATSSKGEKNGYLTQILFHKFWVDELYDLLFVKPFDKVSAFIAKVIDPKIIDSIFLSSVRLVREGSLFLSFLQMGSVQFYLWVMISAVCLVFYALVGVFL